MMGGGHERVIDDDARGQDAPESAQGDDHADHASSHHGVLHGTLARLPDQRPLMPLAMASHSSCNLGRNSVMARMAMTTSTQVSK